MTKEQIKVILDENEIDYEINMTKKKLESLLPIEEVIEEIEAIEEVLLNTTSDFVSFDVKIIRKINLFDKKDMVEGTRKNSKKYFAGDIITGVSGKHKNLIKSLSSHVEII